MAAYTYSDWVGDPYSEDKSSSSMESKRKGLLGSLRNFFTKMRTNPTRQQSKKVRKGLYMRSHSEEDLRQGKSAFMRKVGGERSSFHHISPYGNISPNAVFTQEGVDISRRQKIANGPRRTPTVLNNYDDSGPFDIPEYMNKQARPSLQDVFDIRTKKDQDTRHPTPARHPASGPTSATLNLPPVTLEPSRNPYPRTTFSHSKQNSHSSDISTSSDANSEKPSKGKIAPVRRQSSGAKYQPGRRPSLGGESTASSTSESESRPPERRQRKIKALNLLDVYQKHPPEHPKPQQLQSNKHVHRKYRRKSEGSPPYRMPLPAMGMGPPVPSYMYPGYDPHGVLPPHPQGFALVPGAPPNHMFPPYHVSPAASEHPFHYPPADDEPMEIEPTHLNVITEEKEESSTSLTGAPYGFDDFTLY